MTSDSFRSNSSDPFASLGPILESGPVIFFVWRADDDWTTEYVSPNVVTLGYAPGDFLSGRVDFAALVHPDDYERVANETHQNERAGREQYRQSYRIVRADGEPCWVDVWTISRRDERGRISHHIGIVTDATDQKNAEAALRESEERFRAVVEQSRDGIAVWTPDGRAVLYNHAMERASGYTQEEVNRQGWYDLVFADPDLRDQAIRTSIRVMLGKLSYAEQQIVRKDGTTAWLSFSFTPVEVAGRQYNLSITTDITQRKLQEQELAFLATHDALTGLTNRRGLEEALQRASGRVQRGLPAALLWFDVDNLNVINESLGHGAGDHALASIASLLRERARPGDVVARIAGDEFAVVLDDTTEDAALVLAERLRGAIHEHHFEHEGNSVNLGVSCGVALLEPDGDPRQTLAQADIAMSRAKEAGRNRVVLYRPDENDLARSSQASLLVTRLREALRLGRFVIHYQPIVRLGDGKVEHYEALLRMRDEGGGLVPPGSFIFAAERFGLMPQMTSWLIREVVARLSQHPGIRVFVNLSAHCLADDALLEQIARLLREAGVDPARLGFEITETVIVRDMAAAERWIQRLRALGCRFALDDFGSGYSSLGYLRHLPVDQIKIDGSLVRTIATDATQRVFVKVIQELGAAIGKEVVAEFVENETIAAILREMGVALGQGYHLGRPGPDLPGGRT